MKYSVTGKLFAVGIVVFIVLVAGIVLMVLSAPPSYSEIADAKLRTVLRELRAWDQIQRVHAAARLGALASSVPNDTAKRVVVPELVKAMRGRDLFVAREAARSLKEYGLRAVSAIPAFIEVISKYPDRDIALFAVEALQGLGTNGATAIPSLCSLCNLDSPVLRTDVAAVRALGRLAHSNSTATTCLRAMPPVQDSEKRAALAVALAKVAAPAPDGVIMAKEMISNSNVLMRQAIIWEIEANGTGTDFSEVIKIGMADSDGAVRSTAERLNRRKR